MLGKRFENNGVATLKLNRLQESMRDQVHAKVSNKTYKFETIPCPVCATQRHDVLSKKDRYGLVMTVVACSECGMVRTSPRMTQQAYNDFYNDEYRKLYVGKEIATEAFYYTQTKKGELLLKLLNSEGEFTGSLDGKFVLEVGCGAGGILSTFKDKGAKVLGIDLGEGYIDWGINNKGLNLKTAFLKDLQLTDKPDLIIYSHVLEHILDPLEELQLVRSICKSDSIVYIEVPGIKAIHQNYRCDLLRYLQNAHTFHFSLNSLSNLMQKSGFEMVYGTEYIRSFWRRGGEVKELSYNNDNRVVLDYLKDLDTKRNSVKNKVASGLSDLKQGLVRLFKRLKPS